MHEMANASHEICMCGVVQVTEEVVRKISMFRAMMNKLAAKADAVQLVPADVSHHVNITLVLQAFILRTDTIYVVMLVSQRRC